VFSIYQRSAVMTTHELWQAALGELELSLSKSELHHLVQNTFVSAFEEGRIVVSVPNTFTKAWLEKKYHAAILKALQNVAKDGVREVHYKVELKPSVPQISVRRSAALRSRRLPPPSRQKRKCRKAPRISA